MNSVNLLNNGSFRGNNASVNYYERRLAQIKKRKIRQNKYRLLTGFIIMMTIMILSVSLVALIFSNGAVRGASAEPIKTYKALVVERDDTLWDIAIDNANLEYYTIESYIKEVKSINGIKGYNIYAGDKLIIPVLKNAEYYSIIR